MPDGPIMMARQLGWRPQNEFINRTVMEQAALEWLETYAKNINQIVSKQRYYAELRAERQAGDGAAAAGKLSKRKRKIGKL